MMPKQKKLGAQLAQTPSPHANTERLFISFSSKKSERAEAENGQ